MSQPPVPSLRYHRCRRHHHHHPQHCLHLYPCLGLFRWKPFEVAVTAAVLEIVPEMVMGQHQWLYATMLVAVQATEP
jgi:hypothetical protein